MWVEVSARDESCQRGGGLGQAIAYLACIDEFVDAPFGKPELAGHKSSDHLEREVEGLPSFFLNPSSNRCMNALGYSNDEATLKRYSPAFSIPNNR